MQEEAATENKEEHAKNIGDTGDHDIASLGNNYMDSSKVSYIHPSICSHITLFDSYLFFYMSWALNQCKCTSDQMQKFISHQRL